jgi:hypothetical protein
MKESKPALIDSLPSEGPTMASSTILAGAGNLPASSLLARSFASSTVKLPVIEERPPAISPCTVG